MSLQGLITFCTIYDVNAYPFYLSKCALLCWHEFQAPDECSDVIAMCTHSLLTCEGRQDKSTHQHTRVFLQTKAKALFMGLVAIHPQEFLFVFFFCCLKYVLDI